MRKRKPIFMCKEHHKEGCTLIAGTGEKNSCLTDQTENELKKSRAVVFTLFKVQSVHISPVLPIFPFFGFSVFSLGSRCYSLVPGSAVGEQGGNKKFGESQKSRPAKPTQLKSGEGKDGALPRFPVHRSARRLTKLVK